MIIKDHIHGNIYIIDAEKKTIEHPLFQRLRYIYQNGLAHLVYPGLTHNRFIHSLGTMVLAHKLFTSAVAHLSKEKMSLFIKKITEDFNNFKIEFYDDPIKFLETSLRLSALTHDIGHLPLSHLTEQWFFRFLNLHFPLMKFFENAQIHEMLTLWLVLDTELIPQEYKKAVFLILLSAYLIKEENLKNLIDPENLKIIDAIKNSIFFSISKIISSDIDADRMDYLLRDGNLSGTTFGIYDMDRLIDAIRLQQDKDGRWSIRFSFKAKSAVESVLTERTRLYRYVYFHRKILLIENLLIQMLEKNEKVKEHLKNVFNKHFEKIAVNNEYEKEFFSFLVGEENGIGFIRVYKADKKAYLKKSLFTKIDGNNSAQFFDDFWFIYNLRENLPDFFDSIYNRREPILLWKYRSEYDRFCEELFTDEIIGNLAPGNVTKFNWIRENSSLIFSKLFEENESRFLLEKLSRSLANRTKYHGFLILAKIPSRKLLPLKKSLFRLAIDDNDEVIDYESPFLKSLNDKEVWEKNDALIWLGFASSSKETSAREEKEKTRIEIRNALLEILKENISEFTNFIDSLYDKFCKGH